MNISIDKQRIYPQKDCYNQLKVSVVHTFIRYEYPHQVIPGMGTHLCFKEDCVVWLESQHVIWILSDPLILGWMPQNMNFISFQTVNCHNETYESTLTSYKTTQIKMSTASLCRKALFWEIHDCMPVKHIIDDTYWSYITFT